MKEEIKSLIPYVIILIVVILIKNYVATTIYVNGQSMYPTLHNKDIMIMDKVFYKIDDLKRFDIVVVQNGPSKIIKRIIGLPGETVEYYNNKLYINGEEVEDKYNKIMQEDFIVTLEGKQYFVMGDNRGDSLDSRIIGPVREENILGKATITIFPFTRIGSK